MAALVEEEDWEGIPHNIADIQAEVSQLSLKHGLDPDPRIVAVSKTKPNAALMAAFNVGQRHFGENYVVEILEKAPSLPSEIEWHFIGHLQSNKAKALIEGVPNLAMIETIDSDKLAKKVDTACSALQRPPLPVMVQVNTSGEASKSGVEPGEETVSLCRTVEEQCPHLILAGLMTIGRYGDSTSECFMTLVSCRDRVREELEMPDDRILELSMGMSADYAVAIECGSTNVRVGSSIFGARKYATSRTSANAAAAITEVPGLGEIGDVR